MCSSENPRITLTCSNLVSIADHRALDRQQKRKRTVSQDDAHDSDKMRANMNAQHTAEMKFRTAKDIYLKLWEMPCKFHAMGKCNKGEDCRFSHGRPAKRHSSEFSSYIQYLSAKAAESTSLSQFRIRLPEYKNRRHDSTTSAEKSAISMMLAAC